MDCGILDVVHVIRATYQIQLLPDVVVVFLAPIKFCLKLTTCSGDVCIVFNLLIQTFHKLLDVGLQICLFYHKTLDILVCFCCCILLLRGEDVRGRRERERGEERERVDEKVRDREREREREGRGGKDSPFFFKKFSHNAHAYSLTSCLVPGPLPSAAG